MRETVTNGKLVKCSRCAGHGVIDGGYLEVNPVDCPDCVGGYQWQYASGAIARYRSGPFVGRAPRDRHA